MRVSMMAFGLVGLLAGMGCSKSGDDEKQLKLLQAKLDDAKAESAKNKAELDAMEASLARVKARADALEAELAKAKAVQAQPQPTDADRKAAEWILRVGGMVRVSADGVAYEYPKDGKLPDGPFRVILADLNKPAGEGKLTNEGMKYLAGLKYLKEVHMNNTFSVTDFSFFKGMDSLEVFHGALTAEGLAQLKSSPGVKDLLPGYFWGNPKIADAEAAGLKDFPNLEILDLMGCEVTNAGLAGLRDLKKLRILGLAKTKITDDGLQHLTGVAELRELVLGATAVNGSGVAQLKALPKLTKLALGDTRITDAGLANLKSLTQLEILLLGTNSGVSDGGLAHLKGLTNLKYLELNGTKVTDDGVKELKKALPNCQIVTK